MSNSITPYSGGQQPAPLSYVPGTTAFRIRREAEEAARGRANEIELVAHQHGVELMRAHNDAVEGQARMYGAGQIVHAAVQVTDAILSDIEASLANASPVRQYGIETLMAAVLPEVNHVAAKSVARLRPS